uniref:Uncharacterized protein n=1 Tax=Actinidia yellowing virus 2 TaxID=2715796 RepID=A0A8B6MVE3_9VIRU|nr:hypothetical protein [Actinidia yellowing virus 2]
MNCTHVVLKVSRSISFTELREDSSLPRRACIASLDPSMTVLGIRFGWHGVFCLTHKSTRRRCFQPCISTITTLFFLLNRCRYRLISNGLNRVG